MEQQNNTAQVHAHAVMIFYGLHTGLIIWLVASRHGKTGDVYITVISYVLRACLYCKAFAVTTVGGDYVSVQYAAVTACVIEYCLYEACSVSVALGMAHGIIYCAAGGKRAAFHVYGAYHPVGEWRVYTVTAEMAYTASCCGLGGCTEKAFFNLHVSNGLPVCR